MVAELRSLMTRFGELKAAHPNVEFIYRDLGASKIADRLDELNNLALTIGYQGSSALTLYPDGKINVATVALFNEFGTENMPARGFMRRAISENLPQIQAAIATAFKEVVELRAKPVPAMHAMGRIIAEMMVEEINTASTWAAPLATSTIEGKGHADPLIETGLMKKSITWAVRKGSALGPIVRQGKVG